MSVRRWAAAGGLIVLLAASGVVSATTPTETDWEQPFRVSAPLGERAEGRNIAGTVHGASLADALSDDSGWESGDGSLWLVVDAGLETVSETQVLAYAMLVVGDRMFSSSDRPRVLHLHRSGLTAGIPVRGLLAFEMPADIRDDPAATAAELRLAISDPRLDSLLVTPIDLTRLDHAANAVVTEREWGRG